ncbi:GNAT family N-acetyltransferase [Longimicrobium sp.]|uniref:GNAT family N-acetyltransferase n=1 Tax=Longimicrobium sp. TaxID=2029185 RepID=UPI002C594AB8|nr:GNAT family N-acetyltransferase [Longimicrobium sp.]HSU17933.1 GNAT family N-acetyltransferase [Longimicrobium sp.]
MLYPETLRAVDGWWAGVFGCSHTALLPRRPTVVPRPAADAYHGVQAMTFGEAAPVATISPALFADFRDPVKAALAGGLDASAPLWAGIFGAAVEAIVGPAAVRCADRATFRPLPVSPAVRLLAEGDEPALARLRAAVTATEWEHGGSEIVHPCAGAFVDGELAALAGYEVWGKSIAHISVVAHPAHRGRGHAAAAVSRIAALALERRLVAQYRTLESNTPSAAIAERLGFVPYARSLAVRLRGEAGGG